MKRILSIVVVLLASTTLYSQSHDKGYPRTDFQTDQPMVHDPVMAFEDSTYYIYSTGMDGTTSASDVCHSTVDA